LLSNDLGTKKGATRPSHFDSDALKRKSVKSNVKTMNFADENGLDPQEDK